MLDAEGVSKTYHTREGPLAVLRDVSVTVGPGESVAFTGESGSGKSTLLHILGCLDAADAGRITLAGVDISSLDETGRARIRRDAVSVIFQQLNLIPSLTVSQNLAFQARLSGRCDPDWLDTLTDRLGLSALRKRYPEELSGGQQQRVAIGRAVAHRPKLVLADEPTGNLDEATAQSVLSLLVALTRQTGAGLLMVTHSTALAQQLDRRLHLSAGRVT